MKACLIIGPGTAFHYEEIYKLLKNNVLRLGHKGFFEEMAMYFTDNEGVKHRLGACYYTTLNVRRDHHFIPTKTYEAQKYPHYDNYDAVECKFKNDLPRDYEGKIGVPTSFFYFYPDLDYEIIEHRGDLKLNGKTVFERLIIRKRK